MHSAESGDLEDASVRRLSASNPAVRSIETAGSERSSRQWSARRCYACAGRKSILDRRKRPDVFVVGAVDQDALFPRCRGAVHHGGAGTTHAGLAAGRPTMICSVFADQPFWGAGVERLGVGAHVPFAKLDATRLREGIERLLAPATVERAGRLGALLRAEPPSTAIIADMVERLGDPAAHRDGPALST